MIWSPTLLVTHLDQHVPQWEEIAVLEVFNVNHSPWIFSSSALFPALTLYDCVRANNSKRNTLLGRGVVSC